MQIVTTTSVFPTGTDCLHILKRLALLGYTALDMAFDYCELSGDPFMADDFEQWAVDLRQQADRLGVCFSHSHGSFDADAEGEIITRNLRCAQILGVKYMVVHPVFRDAKDEIIADPEQFLSVNQPLFTKLSRDASKYGITILSENLLWGASILPSIQSQLVDRVSCSNFGWCFDTGHLNRCSFNADALLGLRHPPLSLHIHDNSGKHDEHLLPGDGSIDWKAYLDTLRAIGYTGDLVLEAHHQSMDAPDDQRNAILAELLRRAKLMDQYFSKEHI